MDADVYTLASPRVGDKDFATFYNNGITNNYRVYNWPDIVPDFPKDPFDNYQQVKGGQEYDSLDYPFTIVISVDCFHSLFTY
jgi:predicted lipase